VLRLRELRRRWVALGARLDVFAQRIGTVTGPEARLVPVARLRRRAHDLGEVRDALYEVQLDLAEPALATLVSDESALPAFLTGLYIWCEGSIDALEGFDPDDLHGEELRARLEHAAHYYFDALVARIRDDVEALLRHAPRAEGTPPLVQDHLEALFFAARWLHAKLHER